MQEIRRNLWVYETVASGVSVRGAVILGERYAAVWDSLAHPADVAPLSSLLADKPFHLIYSHADWDHCWGTSGLARAPVDIVAHAACRQRFDADVPDTLSRMQLADMGRWDAVRLVPPNLMFSANLTLNLGGISLELWHMPGHTLDCIVGWLPEWGVLLGGDAFETPLPVVNDAAAVDGWLASLEAWAAREDIVQCIPSHGTCRGRDALERTVVYLRALKGDRRFDLPGTLGPFYAETHQNNLGVMDAAQDPAR